VAKWIEILLWASFFSIRDMKSGYIGEDFHSSSQLPNKTLGYFPEIGYEYFLQRRLFSSFTMFFPFESLKLAQVEISLLKHVRNF